MPRLRNASALVVMLVFVCITAGCGSQQSTPLLPMPAGNGSQLGLGNGVTPLTYGPGYKSAPEWNPDGDLISFVVDGYVVDRRTPGGSQRVLTTRDFDAQSTEWLSSGRVVILGNAAERATQSESSEDYAGDTLYVSGQGGGSSEVSEISSGVLAMNASEPGGEILLASRSGDSNSSVSIIGTDGILSSFEDPVEGTVTGISFSPEGNNAVLAVDVPGEGFAFVIFDVSTGEHRTLVTLPESQSVAGDPQWTKDGIYYIVRTSLSSEGDDSESGASNYALEKINPETTEPESAPGLGREFSPSSVTTSPDGNQLAVVGRLRADSPSNLYILDTRTTELRSVTNNEDMEIKNGSRDIAWAPNGESVAIVARGSFSGPIVRNIPADTMLDEFYNLYAVPVSGDEDEA